MSEPTTIKEHFEANMLDGDEVQGGQMLSSEFVLNYLYDFLDLLDSKVIGKDENHITIDTGVSIDVCDILKDSSLDCNCPAGENNNLRRTQRQALKELGDK
jgi:hypothetical protein